MHAAVALTARTALLTSLAFVAGCSRSSDRVVFDGRITQVDAAALERACGPRDPNAVSNPPLPPGKQWAKFGLPLEHLTTDPTYVCHVTWDARTGVVEAIHVPAETAFDRGALLISLAPLAAPEAAPSKS